MTAETLKQQLDRCLVRTEYADLGERYEGKVRDTYRPGDSRLVLVTTDRISAFDHVLPQPIPFKGQVLNRLAAWHFERTSDIVPNHVLAVPHPAATLARACRSIPVEFVVRGYLAGHAARTYGGGRRELCGVALPEGLREGDRLPAPILTPATKAAEGHDEDVSRDEIVRRGVLTADLFDRIAAIAVRLFERGTEIAAERGLLLVDTKYEFGLDPQGDVVLIDEVHTPDSSRYYYADGYDERQRAGEPQRQLSKEFVREWLMDNGFRGLDGQRVPDLPDAFRLDVSRRYIELFERLTGTAFEGQSDEDPAAAVHAAVRATL